MKRTRLVMAASSFCLVVGGISCLFAPEETAAVFRRIESDPLVIQLLGAFYLALGSSNWMARGSMIGGIYARPLSVANFSHFLVGAIVLAKEFLAAASLNLAYGILTMSYALFAVAFSLMLYGRLESTGNSQ